MSEQEKAKYLDKTLAELVRKIETLQNTLAGYSANGNDISADWVADHLDEVLEVQSPDGRSGRLTFHEETNSTSIFLGARITGERIISTHPGDFNGVVWSEEMDRAPRSDEE